MTTRLQARAGFTLLEVMIAVVILAVGLSSLFTSEAGAIRIAQRARTTTIATLLARCKMGEVEEKIRKEGWPATAMDERDECCVGAEHEGFSCEWKIDRIVLPELTDEKGNSTVLDSLRGGTGAAGAAGAMGAAGASGAPPGSPAGGGLGSPMGLPPLGATGAPASPLQSLLSGKPDAGVGALSSGSSGSGGGGADPIAALAMQFAFPLMKPVIEEQVRRATVTVKWKEGSSDQTFELVQFLVNELPMLMPQVDEENDPGSTAAGTAGTPPATPGPGGAPASGTAGRR